MFKVNRHIRSDYVTTVTEEEKYEGLWWVNEQEDQAVSGYLHVTPKGTWLSLNGTLNSSENLFQSSFTLHNHDLLFGIQSSGYRFTLETCTEFQKHSPLGSGYSIQTFSVDRVYCGIHVSSLEELKFSEYCVTYTYLEDWLRNVGLGSPEEVEGGFFVSYEPNKATTVSQLNIELQQNEIAIEIKSSPGWSHYNNTQECKIEIQTVINVFCKSPMSFSEVSIKVLDPIRNFLNLATVNPNSVTSLSAKVGDLRVYIHSKSPYKRQRHSSLFNRSIILFNAKDIVENPNSYINKWIEIDHEMRDVCELFFGVHYDQGAFATNRLLNLVQALEAYSRVRYGEYKISKEEHSIRSKNIIKTVSEEYKDWLRQALSHANKKSLKEHLIELIDNAHPISEKLFPDSIEFSKWVVDTRNYLTHRDLEGKKRIATGDKLELMIHSILWLLRIQFLLEIGFDKEQCMTLLKNNRNFKSLCDDPDLEIPWKANRFSVTK